MRLKRQMQGRRQNGHLGCCCYWRPCSDCAVLVVGCCRWRGAARPRLVQVGSEKQCSWLRCNKTNSA
jgi:hypothetical protein